MIFAPFRIIQPSGRVTIGTPYEIGDDDKSRCPECKQIIEDDDYNPGYGFAYGGGLGTYWVCDNDDCPWFYKQLDMPEAA